MNKCQCGKIPGDPFMCGGQTSSENSMQPYILYNYCITIVGNLTEVVQCIYNHGRLTKHIKFTRNDLLIVLLGTTSCEIFLAGLGLGSQCDKERNCYPHAYSFDLSCIQCDGSMSNLWKYILLAYFPLTVFYLLLLFLKLDIHSSQLQVFIIFSQFISAPVITRNILLETVEMPFI